MTNIPAPRTYRPISEEALRIAEQLHESQSWRVQKVIDVIGLERAEDLVQQTLTIQTAGGMRTDNGKRRRTTGGVFLKLVKNQTTPDERRAVFSSPYPAPRMDWQEAEAVAQQLAQSEEAERTETMYVTVTGIPRKITKLKHCMAVALVDTPARDVPKGLPQPPEEMKHRVIVFIAYPQWERIKRKAAQGIYARGVLMPDPKNNLSIVLTQEARAVRIQSEEQEETASS